MNDVTFGITHFDRPTHLQRCVASIRRFYPKAKIVIADNSVKERPVVSGAKILHLPPDCGLSACRNAIVDQLDTKYYLVLEEDFVFTLHTDVNRFVTVLESNPDFGVIGGSLTTRGVTRDYATRLVKYGSQTAIEDTSSPWQVTGNVCWRACDQTYNFFLVRSEVVRQCRWDESIKIGGEHVAWFHALKHNTNWAVGHTPQVIARHEVQNRDDHYLRHRQRKTEKPLNAIPYTGFLRTLANKPNIVVFGIGHSGTTIVSKLLTQFGWTVPNNDEQYYEDRQARNFNISIIRGGNPNLKSYVHGLTGPWLIKDPRMVVTLERWYEAFASLPQQPLLIGIRRNLNRVLESYTKRGENPERSHGGHSVRELVGVYKRQFSAWPWAKIEIRYEDLAAAAKLFEQGR